MFLTKKTLVMFYLIYFLKLTTNSAIAELRKHGNMNDKYIFSSAYSATIADSFTDAWKNREEKVHLAPSTAPNATDNNLSINPFSTAA